MIEVLVGLVGFLIGVSILAIRKIIRSYETVQFDLDKLMILASVLQEELQTISLAEYEAKVITSQCLHHYFCVQHGGSPATEKEFKKNGFVCPICERYNSMFIEDEERSV